ncbi:hypothetical protein ABMA27_000686 [Loxostege sticticalis]|uniref:MD-2-related lipid-recognition domain-containing protein n=1 Tax=Loxostege sticticalis TaxID=481309 RepID=A0ABR3I049_LOXSC
MKGVAVAIVAILATAEAGPTQFTPCQGVPQDACTVQEVNIRDCDSYPCQIKRGEDMVTEVTGTPYFTSDDAVIVLEWMDDIFGYPITVNNGGRPENACQYTTCPLQAGEPSTLVYKMPVSSMYMPGTYTFRGKLYNPDDESQVCCFETQAEIV